MYAGVISLIMCRVKIHQYWLVCCMTNTVYGISDKYIITSVASFLFPLR
jgi:hypothetical protein